MKLSTLTAVFALLLIAVPAPSYSAWIVDGTAVCTAINNQWFPVGIAPDGAGGAIITWYDQRGGPSDIYAQRVDTNGNMLWSANGILVEGATGNQFNPAIIPDGVGGAIIVWYDQRSLSDFDIYAQRVNSAGVLQWRTSVGICTEDGDQRKPQLITDGASGAIIVWEDKRNGTDYDIYAQRVNASGVVQFATNGIVLCAESGEQERPRITFDGGARAIVTWDDDRGSDLDIYAAMVDNFGNVPWAANGVAVTTASGNQLEPAIVTDGSSGAVIVWSDYRVSSIDAEIYAQRLNAAGNRLWGAADLVVCSQPNNQRFPQIVSGGGGYVIIGWMDDRVNSISTDIYAQRLSIATGSAMWLASGIPISTAANKQQGLSMDSDGYGGAVIAWQDARVSPSNNDLYAQHINGAGAAQWTANGLAMSQAVDHQSGPAITSDGAGGAIVAWVDRRNGVDYDIYAMGEGDSVSPAAVPDLPLADAFAVRNVPNPFRDGTEIQFDLPRASAARVEVFDAAGRRVFARGLERRSVGRQSVFFSGRDEAGERLPSGVYFYQVEALGQRVTRKMVLVR